MIRVLDWVLSKVLEGFLRASMIRVLEWVLSRVR